MLSGNRYLDELVQSQKFELIEWDTQRASIHGPAQYTGTHAEVLAYLNAWKACSATSSDPGDHVTKPSILALAKWGQTNNPRRQTTILARPQVSAFRGVRLAIPDQFARLIRIDDIRVGNFSCMPQAQSIDGEVFACRLDNRALLRVTASDNPARIDISEAATAEFGREIYMPLCHSSQDIVLFVSSHNPDGEDLDKVTCFVLGFVPRHS